MRLRRGAQPTGVWRTGVMIATCFTLASCANSVQVVEPAPLIPALDPGDGTYPTAAARPHHAVAAGAPAAPGAQAVAAPVAKDPAPSVRTAAIRSSAAPDPPDPQPRAAAASAPGDRPPTVHAVARTDAPMPTPGVYAYTLRGQSSLGDLPKAMHVRVSGPPESQHWVLDASGPPDRVGSVEDLSVGRAHAGVLLRSDDLTITSPVQTFVLHFRPTFPVLLLPPPQIAARGWAFTMTSTDGCAVAHSVGSIVHDATTDTEQHIRFDTTVTPGGASGCQDISARRIQDIWHSAGSLLPTRLACDVFGRVTGVPVTMSRQAALRGNGQPCAEPGRRRPESSCG